MDIFGIFNWIFYYKFVVCLFAHGIYLNFEIHYIFFVIKPSSGLAITINLVKA